MIFSAGVGVGLFFYGVSEPLFHREKDNYYSNAGYHSQNEIDQWSLVITMYHWGLAAWSPCKFQKLRLFFLLFIYDLTIRSIRTHQQSFSVSLHNRSGGSYCHWIGNIQIRASHDNPVYFLSYPW